MSRRGISAPPRLELIQWFVTLGAPLAWAGQFVVGLGTSIAACNPGGSRLGVNATSWQIALTAAASAVAAAGLALSVLLFLRTREAASAPPPASRHRFFAYAGIGENAVFLALALMTGLGPLYHYPCTQA